jgi:hypothetical protein
MLEKYHVAYPCCPCLYDINLETVMVFHGCLDVEYGFVMLTFSWVWTANPRIMLAVDVGIGQYLWGNVGLAE